MRVNTTLTGIDAYSKENKAKHTKALNRIF